MNPTNPKAPKYTTRINNMPEDPSKQDEVDFLNRVAKAIPQNSYLKDLLNDKLIAWAAYEIQMDFPPDVMMWKEDWREKAGAAGAQVQEMKNQLDGQKRQHEFDTRQNLSRIADLEKTLEYEREIYNREQRQARDLTTDLSNRIKNLSDDFHTVRIDLNEKEQELEKANQEILTLKAKMHDLISGTMTTDEMIEALNALKEAQSLTTDEN